MTNIRNIFVFGVGYAIPAKSRFQKCKCNKCGRDIYWAKTQNNKNMPFEIFTYGDFVNHFAICPGMVKKDEHKTIQEQIS
ncbi:MAG TPA: hypothetical protein VK255_03215 [Patescibacteria group bacterium]|nr:hypothetical protein [Patescibacteria group bacterium]